MVYLTKKLINGENYLYLQAKIYKDGKRFTRHVKYLGKENKVTQEQIQKELAKYKEAGKNEDSRTTRQTRKS